MDIEKSITEPLWNAIKGSYNSGNFTGSIQDATYYLSDFIREKSGLEGDGVELIGQAFGGKSPKIKVNILQTESDLNVQKGVTNILLGIYQGVRNPRSHNKYDDKQEDADAIILFINYLLKLIGKSKGIFSKDEFLKRVFDSSFVESERYANLLADEIPLKYRFDVIVEAYKRKGEGDPKKIKVFFQVLLEKLDEDTKQRLFDVVSDELQNTNDESSVRITYHLFPADFITRLDESARLRSENRFILSIREGKYDVLTKKCIKGAFGTWCNEAMSQFFMKDECILALTIKLGWGDVTEQDYVLNFFIYQLIRFVDTLEGDQRNWIRDIILEYLKKGDKRFYGVAKWAIENRNEFWKQSLEEAVNHFQETANPIPSDDIPF